MSASPLATLLARPIVSLSLILAFSGRRQRRSAHRSPPTAGISESEQLATRGPTSTAHAPPAGGDRPHLARGQRRLHAGWRRSPTAARAAISTFPRSSFSRCASRGARQHPALVWVHENIRGHLYEHYIPYIREATARGYVVIAPEYRGSIGYGKAFYDAIDYGGAEVDDVVTAARVLATRYPAVDPARIGIIGWSHGGMIALLSIFRNPTTFRAAVAIVPVTNLFHRLARKGVERQRRAIDPQNRFGGSPAEKPRGLSRSIAALSRRQAADSAARARRRQRRGRGHRRGDAARGRAAGAEAGAGRVEGLPEPARRPHCSIGASTPSTWQPENTPEQRDSWARVWGFLDNHLQPPYN